MPRLCQPSSWGRLDLVALCLHPAGAQTGVEGPSMRIESKLPWEPDGKVAAGFAVQNLQLLLLNAAKDQRGVHVETLMTIVGALAGFSAQHAVWETVVKTGK